MTPRQRDVAALVARGLSDKQIARELGRSPATIKNHVHAVLRATGVANRYDVAAALARKDRSLVPNLVANLPAILFAAGSALFLVGNLVLIWRGWR